MAEVGRVKEIVRYPVKSMQGEALDRVHLGDQGLDGDRAYALFDSESGFVVSAKRPKRWGDVLRCTARSSSGETRVELPTGEEYGIDDPALLVALSAFFGRSVSLVDRAPEGSGFEEVWVRDLKADAGPYFEQPSRVVDGEEMIVGGRVMARNGNLFNFGTVHLVTTGCLRRLAELAPDVDFDARRFRPNLLIDTGPVGFVENDWVGRRLRIGGIDIRVTIAVPRCVMTTLPFGDVPADRDVLRSVTAHNRIVPMEGMAAYPCVGVYADPTTDGEIAVGDSVNIAD
jgi:MOSC domain-containing protein